LKQCFNPEKPGALSPGFSYGGKAFKECELNNIQFLMGRQLAWPGQPKRLSKF